MSSVSPAELAARASPTSGNPRGRTADLRLDFKSPHSGSLPPGTIPPQVNYMVTEMKKKVININLAKSKSKCLLLGDDWRITVSSQQSVAIDSIGTGSRRFEFGTAETSGWR